MNIKKDRAILVGLDLQRSTVDMTTSLIELENLAEALNIETVDKVIQKATKVSPRFYIGTGKAAEIKKMVKIMDIDIVIFDDPLSPAQLVNLERELNCQVIDRSFLILSIFSERAQSKQSVLEVSLAQKQYMLPRLIGLGKSLSRQGGGTYNAKGPGETKLETDRRRLMDDITAIRRELDVTIKEKSVSRKRRQRNTIPIVALVGYTNVGKSSIMNSLTSKLNFEDETVDEKNMLFTTLDTKTKKLQKDNNPPFLLIDTVGFVQKLPHELVNSFESTLSDVLDADLLLHIVDGAHFKQEHIDTTKDVLKRIGAENINRLMVLTKKDMGLPIPHIDQDYIFISNKTGENMDQLIDAIYGNLYNDSRFVKLKLPFSKGDVFNLLNETTKILNTSFNEDGYLLEVLLSPRQLEQYKEYIIK